ncbi:MAG: ABC transporter [Mesorhizobium amorphae]|nr:MAG: ABC transporter [Mesorhizobium amorphae]
MRVPLVLRHIAFLVRLTIAGPGGKAGVPLYFVVLALELASVLVGLRLIAWTKDFYDALQGMNVGEALRQVGIFGVIVVAEVARELSASYLRKLLEIRWRRALTAQVLDRYLADKTFWRLGASGIDNPDQRIAEDCRLFLAGPATDHSTQSGAIPLSMDVVTRVVGLFSYLAVLWGLSTFPLPLSFLGVDWELSRYMVWAAFLYVALASGVTHLLGRQLKGLYFDQQRREADYRFALARLRENVDAIALSNGEGAERRGFGRLFDAIMVNWRRLIGRELILSSFTYPYRFTVLRIPTFLGLPAFFGGGVTFGGLMQLGSAFSQVVTTLSWFIFAYRPLAELAAAASRLGAFVDAAEASKSRRTGPDIAPSPDGRLRVRSLRVCTATGQTLFSLPALELQLGQTVWLKGVSGVGKTTLLKTLAGLWPHAEGEVDLPRASLLFLPQQPYAPLGAVADAVAYPAAEEDFAPGTIEKALRTVGVARLGTDGLAGLSGGERQRLMLARLLVHRPDWAFLDEATSALDPEAEQALFSALRTALPQTTFVVVSHREPLGLGPVRTVPITSTPHSFTLQPA